MILKECAAVLGRIRLNQNASVPIPKFASFCCTLMREHGIARTLALIDLVS
jgi:hypothetical protein